MKVLWVINIETNSIASKFDDAVVHGGWLEYSSILLSNEEGINLSIACNTTNEYFDLVSDGISFYSFDSYKRNERELTERAEKILDYIKPDVVHIWGTEYIHSLVFMRACERKNIKQVVIYIQGLISIIPIHYCVGLPKSIIKKKTIPELLFPFRFRNIYEERKSMIKDGHYEEEILSRAKYCIGRTDWDYACVKKINRDIKYFCLNEIMRKPFYEARKWVYDKCEKNTIFFSQAHYPLKGFHIMLQALKIIKSRYPNVILKVVGNNPMNGSFKERLTCNTYQRYIFELIRKLELEKNIIWLGSLNAEEMIDNYLRSNVFVCASTIENSSNSIAEAMLLGLPIVASDVGGVKSSITHNINGVLYQSDAFYMLAEAVIQLFDNPKFASRIAEKACDTGMKMHDKETIIREFSQIYNEIVNS